jgi:hypothetical protein
VVWVAGLRKGLCLVSSVDGKVKKWLMFRQWCMAGLRNCLCLDSGLGDKVKKWLMV